MIDAETVQKMRELVAVQGSSGNWNYDPYMHGMFNGMVLILAMVEGTNPEFREAPEVWLRDLPAPTLSAEPESEKS